MSLGTISQSTWLPRWLISKESICQCRRCRWPRFSPWVRKVPWRRKWQPTPVSLPEKSHGQRSLPGLQKVGRNWVCMHWKSTIPGFRNPTETNLSTEQLTVDPYRWTAQARDPGAQCSQGSIFLFPLRLLLSSGECHSREHSFHVEVTAASCRKEETFYCSAEVQGRLMHTVWVPCQSPVSSLVFWVLGLSLASWGPGCAGIQVCRDWAKILLISQGGCPEGRVLGRQNRLFIQNWHRLWIHLVLFQR